jgi:hypothetical protein
MSAASATTEQGQGAAESASEGQSAAIDTAGFGADRKVEKALLTVAEKMGNCRQAQKALAKDGIKVAHQTLWEWTRRRHVERYEELRAKALPKIRAELVGEHIELARLNMEAEAATLKEYRAADLPARDRPGAARNFAVGGAIHTEKSEELSAGPPLRVKIDLQGVLAELREMGVDPHIVIDAEVLSEEDVEPQPDIGPYHKPKGPGVGGGPKGMPVRG